MPYTATVASKMLHATRVNKFGIFAGKVDITSYNTTRLAIPGISGKFKSVIGVTFGTSDLGFIFEWIAAQNSIKAYYFNYPGVSAAAALEAVNDADVGAADFIAFGLLS